MVARDSEQKRTQNDWKIRYTPALIVKFPALIAKNPRHRVMLWMWLFVYCFVAIQMAWVLRPFIGQPGISPSFFRKEAWGNAYVAVLETLLEVWRH